MHVLLYANEVLVWFYTLTINVHYYNIFPILKHLGKPNSITLICYTTNPQQVVQ